MTRDDDHHEQPAETPSPFATTLRQHVAVTRLARQMYGARRAWEGDRHPDWKSIPVEAKHAYVRLAGDLLEALRRCPSDPRQDQLSQAILHKPSNTPTLHLVKGETRHVPEF